MICFLTSNPCVDGANALSPANGLVDALLGALPGRRSGLFVCSSPDSPALTDGFAADLRGALEAAGIAFVRWDVLDNRRAADADEMIQLSDFIVLAGGHVPTQNAFFESIRLKALLQGWDGVLIGISAGTMNSAETVYAHPELPGEAVDPAYRRFLPGFGLTQTMVLPHFHAIRHDVLDGLRVIEDIACPDSAGRRFLCLPDGSYIRCDGCAETLFGEAWRLQDGVLTRIAARGDALPLE